VRAEVLSNGELVLRAGSPVPINWLDRRVGVELERGDQQGGAEYKVEAP
jgi:hypothetical protein